MHNLSNCTRVFAQTVYKHFISRANIEMFKPEQGKVLAAGQVHVYIYT